MPAIVELVEQIRKNSASQAQAIAVREIVDEARLRAELECAATLDPKDMFDKEGRLLAPVELPEAVRRAIASMKIKQDADGVARFADIKFIDKPTAIKMLGQDLGMFKDVRVYEHKLADMTDAELAAEAERLAQAAQEQAAQAELHGVKLSDRRH
jgi:hypothetical protein